MVDAVSFQTLFNATSNRPHEKSQRSFVKSIRVRKGARRRLSFLVKSEEKYSSSFGHLATVTWPTIFDLAKVPETNKAHLSPFTARVRVFCSCPAFQYWGAAYHSTVDRYKLTQKPGELRPPNIRDPAGTYYLCKHIIRVGSYVNKMTFPVLAQWANLIPRTAAQQMQIVADGEPTVSVEEAKPAIEAWLQSQGMSRQAAQERVAFMRDDDWESYLEGSDILPSSQFICEGV